MIKSVFENLIRRASDPSFFLSSNPTLGPFNSNNNNNEQDKPTTSSPPHL
ncbi:hypothetical protein DFA_05993 [Cavenderia fasciculata]|uniref:Uncharacterized protein n=1 Tax=Cavenderia fasciculata TaxID=261658 RepID=F4PJT3_CACFS|nr:uncharacterized protein DFA_05993 [Cavenderia fasciculata]EGG23857.1 hypothetical protein DFA_05993 [Cavenderia fasciculata]|eukprot:XP_004361708.1 hypothetical protein DFA_05993 [Cavenderia fasciculata]